MAAFITNTRQRRIKNKMQMTAQKEIIRRRMERSLKSIGKGLSRTLTTMSESKKKHSINDIEVERFILPYQEVVKNAYGHQTVQVAVAAIIFSNFVCSSAEKQLIPDPGSTVAKVFYIFENFFCYIFLSELLINMYGSFFYPFWKSAWNCFDFLIVVIAFMALYSATGSGLSILRLFRAFRVFRLFKRIQTLRCIIEGVIASLPGVFNAFVILGLIMGIWSIMGVAFFGKLGIPESKYFERFGDAMFTLWQCMTMDSWASEIARPLIHETQGIGYVYFVSYIFVSGIVLSNVVVAILLEKYLAATKGNRKEEEEETEFDFHENLVRSCEAITEAIKNHTIQALDLALKASAERLETATEDLPGSVAQIQIETQLLPSPILLKRKRAHSCVSHYTGEAVKSPIKEDQSRWDLGLLNTIEDYRPEIVWNSRPTSSSQEPEELKPKEISGKLCKITKKYSAP